MTYFKALSESKIRIMQNIVLDYQKVKKGELQIKASASTKILDKEIQWEFLKETKVIKWANFEEN